MGRISSLILSAFFKQFADGFLVLFHLLFYDAEDTVFLQQLLLHHAMYQFRLPDIQLMLGFDLVHGDVGTARLAHESIGEVINGSDNAATYSRYHREFDLIR